jgi:PAS domain-containing protein
MREVAEAPVSVGTEVAARERAEEALRASEARLKGIITIDADQRITLFDAAEQMFRCSAAEMMGQPIDRLIPERFRQAHRAHVRTFGETGHTQDPCQSVLPYDRAGRDSAVRHFLFHQSLVRDLRHLPGGHL